MTKKTITTMANPMMGAIGIGFSLIGIDATASK